MPETPSSMLPLGSTATHFSLLETRSNRYVSLEECCSSIATVIMFLSNHCPYVKHIQQKLLQVVEEYQMKGVAFVAISSNDVAQFPEDGPDKMRDEARKFNYPFSYLYDDTQEIAKAFHAACTPDFYIFNKDLLCVYRGCLDESTPGNGKPVSGDHLKKALDDLLSGKPINQNQKPSLGCNIKWKIKSN